MCIGYDPFKWSDNFESYEEMLEEKERETENGKEGTDSCGRNTSNARIE